ncbi:DUF885 domain-containing protein [Phenylobacterium hankyongense]|uniref:DUF885 domain-containing protein n=1 Tax=Phenylobacterium hankyongense TaxID=1813876 RepID=A0A328AXQ3_9CAUL|nr:DUF885 domain-containing protein [Phenylobacterium hankyongense]RAK58476.1 DUF885 domain-containing protein [Phenylobacterium hankyongense]
MSFARRDLLLTAAAAGLIGAAPKPHKVAPHAAAAAPPTPAGPGDAALDRYFADLSEQLLIASPEQATSLGLDTGRRAGLKSQLTDRSWSAVVADRNFCRDNLARLQASPDAGLSAQARLNRDVVAYALELGRDAAPFDYGDNTLSSAMSESATPYVVSQQGGAYSAVPEFLDSQHKVATPEDADAYLDRLHAMSRMLSQETDRIGRDAAQGVIAPDFILANTIGQQQDLLAVPADKARLVTSLERKVKEAHLAGDYAERARGLVEREVYPALARQLETLKGLQPKAGRDAGVWRLPQGEAYYSWLLREGTSTSLTAEQVHQMGQDQNRAIEARMDGLLKAQGLTHGTVGERMTALGADPRYLFPDTDAGRAQLLAYLNGLIAAVRPKLPKAFTLKLKAPVQVKRVPVDIQDGAGQGYMNTGSLDGSRPSTYYINLKSTLNWPKFSLPTLTYHETIPGHAWQGAYLTETGKLPLIRILLSGFNAYVEGYALYAEQLADEIGMYDADWAGRLGYLQAQRFRAVRLVVDTGLHAKRWSREQAIQWAMDNTGRTRDSMTSEIDRYTGTPGQACGYKVGHTEINRLRDHARQALGARYDLRRFHDLLVETGSVPLTVLSSVVDSYVAGGGRLQL